jgi:hypothetical protein
MWMTMFAEPAFRQPTGPWHTAWLWLWLWLGLFFKGPATVHHVI